MRLGEHQAVRRPLVDGDRNWSEQEIFLTHAGLDRLDFDYGTGRSSLMSNLTIAGDGNVVGDRNEVITEVNRMLAADPARATAAKALALLRAAIEVSAVEDRHKRRAKRAVVEVEQELAERDPDAEAIESALRRAHDHMLEAGGIEDSGTDWAPRLAAALAAVFDVIPEARSWRPF
jgi:tryptophan 2,3-dioxygenase